jgi:hypothetical protein
MPIIPNMYVSYLSNMQESTKKSKMLVLFNALGENDKDIVIAMTESLVKRGKENTTTEITTMPVAPKRRLTMNVN